jgi:hypothetical protein
MTKTIIPFLTYRASREAGKALSHNYNQCKEKAGSFSIAHSLPIPPTMKYRPNSDLLHTDWDKIIHT